MPRAGDITERDGRGYTRCPACPTPVVQRSEAGGANLGAPFAPRRWPNGAGLHSVLRLPHAGDITAGDGRGFYSVPRLSALVAQRSGADGATVHGIEPRYLDMT